MDPTGVFEPVAGAVKLSGVVECSRQAFVDIYVVVEQGPGREPIRGAALFSQQRCVGATPWSVEVTNKQGLFVAGAVDVTASAYAYTEDEFFGYDEVSLPVRLNVEERTLQLVGQLGGDSYAVEVVGRYVYLGIGPRLVILDITNPERPARVGQTRPLCRFVIEPARGLIFLIR